MFSTKMRYASMFMLDLAKNLAKGKALSISNSSCNGFAAKSYFEEVVGNLRKNGLIISKKGRSGGYSLAKSSDQISVADIADAVCGRVEMQKCGYIAECVGNGVSKECGIDQFFTRLDSNFNEYLKYISLKDLSHSSNFGYIHADCNASMPASVNARAAFLYACDAMNPSSPGKSGQFSRRLIENSESVIKDVLNAGEYNVIFTNSGTSANNLALKGCRGFTTVVSAIEHPSVSRAANSSYIVPVDDSGVVDLAALDKILVGLSDYEVLLSVMWANNETGVVQPVGEIAKICKARGVLLHTDAVQVCGKIPMDIEECQADLVTVSAHKMGGVGGTGALIVKKNIALEALIAGGGQAKGLFSGTENTASIYSFGVVMRDLPSLVSKMNDVGILKNKLEESVKKYGEDVSIIGDSVERLPNTSMISMPWKDSSLQIALFDASDISIGAGSACSYGKSEISEVLNAMRVPKDKSSCAVRISLGYDVTDRDIMRIIDCWGRIYRGSTKNMNIKKTGV